MRNDQNGIRPGTQGIRRALRELHEALGGGCLETRGDRVAVTDEVTADVLEFAAAAEGGRPAEALRLYGGPFLQDAGLAVTPRFEAWAIRWCSRVERLAGTAALAVGEWGAARDAFARRVGSIDAGMLGIAGEGLALVTEGLAEERRRKRRGGARESRPGGGRTR